MRIRIATPAPKGSRRGNRITAERWAEVLASLGHRVRVESALSGDAFDVLVALHAEKGAAAVAAAKRSDPERPVVLALTGTDVEGRVGLSRRARKSMEDADVLVVLQRRMLRSVPRALRHKAVVVVQSAVRDAAAMRVRPRRGTFQVCALAHLRAVKDPLLLARAVRSLPASSRVRVVHAGAALDAASARAARAESRSNPRWRWVGEVSHARAMRLLRESRALVLTSRAEGGPGVVGEAVVHGVPVLATRIPAVLALLGSGYRGTFRPGDAAALARLLGRAERDPRFLRALAKAGRAKAAQFGPARERAAWRTILASVARRSLAGGRLTARRPARRRRAP